MQIDDLNAAIDTLSTDLADVATNVGIVLAELKAAQSAGTGMTNDQVAGLVAKLGTADASLKSVDASLKAVEPAPPVVTPGA